MDGSFHAWLEERGPEGCLIDMVDDATNTTWAQLGEQETIWAAADALRAWVERYGVPLALYVDWKNLYKRPAGERLRGQNRPASTGAMFPLMGLSGLSKKVLIVAISWSGSFIQQETSDLLGRLTRAMCPSRLLSCNSSSTSCLSKPA